MTNARAAIFAKLPRSVDESPLLQADKILAASAPYKQRWGDQSITARFIEKCSTSPFGTTVEAVSEHGLVSALESYLNRLGLVGAPRYIAPGLAAYALEQMGQSCTPQALEADGGVSIMLADYGIAETGSVIITSKAGQPVLPHWLSEHAIVLVRAENVLAYPEDVWARTGGAMPRFLSMVTGPSSTADIEAKAVRGAHGPRSMHIMLLGA